MAKAKAKAEEPSDLQLAVEELNEVCGFSPALDHTAGNIEEELKEAAAELKESDKLSDATWLYLGGIGALPEWKQPKKSTKNKNTEDDDMASKGKDKAAAPAKGKDKKTSSGEKKPGVIAEIRKVIADKGPITRENILKHLVKKFPDREEASMWNTVKIQVPGRISSEFSELVGKDGAYKFKKAPKI